MDFGRVSSLVDETMISTERTLRSRSLGAHESIAARLGYHLRRGGFLLSSRRSKSGLMHAKARRHKAKSRI